jgi:hypothetical protein
MKIKTDELIGKSLDWAVAKIENPEWSDEECILKVSAFDEYDGTICNYSEDWVEVGSILEREGINLSVNHQDDALGFDMIQVGWKANLWNNSVPGTSGFMQWAYGPTPAVAAMRCYVCARLGKEVDVPDELLVASEAVRSSQPPRGG